MHPLFKREDLGTAIGHSGAALVEHDDPSKRCKPAEKGGARRRLPERFDIRDKTRDEQQVARTIANHLIGNMDVVTFDVMSGRDVSHVGLLRDKTAVRVSHLVPRQASEIRSKV